MGYGTLRHRVLLGHRAGGQWRTVCREGSVEGVQPFERARGSLPPWDTGSPFPWRAPLSPAPQGPGRQAPASASLSCCVSSCDLCSDLHQHPGDSEAVSPAVAHLLSPRNILLIASRGAPPGCPQACLKPATPCSRPCPPPGPSPPQRGTGCCVCAHVRAPACPSIPTAAASARSSVTALGSPWPEH